MAYAFNDKPVATIRAKVTNSTDTVTVPGTNPTSTPENAKAQIDKILKLTGTKSVTCDGMTRTRQEEAINNG